VIEALFPPGVVVVRATPEMLDDALHPAEATRLPRMSEKRRREFALGRACARRALARLGIHDFALRNDADRSPIWPEGVVGSLTHCRGLCAAAVARRDDLIGIGLDAEAHRALAPRLLERICTARERAHLAGLPSPERGSWGIVAFSAKESFYKCYPPLARRGLGFHDVDLEIDAAAGRFRVRLLREDAPAAAGVRTFQGRFLVDATHVVSAVALAEG
jgi:4'-phosphopantetheinyl transferase EntD